MGHIKIRHLHRVRVEFWDYDAPTPSNWSFVRKTGARGTRAYVLMENGWYGDDSSLNTIDIGWAIDNLKVLSNLESVIDIYLDHKCRTPDIRDVPILRRT